MDDRGTGVDEDERSFHSKGGRARAAKLSPARREQIASKAAAARWADFREGAPLPEAEAEAKASVTLRLPGALMVRLMAVAEAEGRSLSALTSAAVAAWLARLPTGKGEP